MRAIGPSYAQREQRGYALPVVELRLRYVAPARFDDLLIVRTALADLRSRSATFTYEVVSDESHPRQLANGMTRHICMRHGEVCRMPEELRRLTSDA
jgi:acyl-CoA thioester hydrolase